MTESGRRRRRSLRGWLRSGDKKRTSSLDETVDSTNHSHPWSDEEKDRDLDLSLRVEPTSGSHTPHGGAFTKATSLLFRRRVSSSSMSDDEDEDEKDAAEKALQEEHEASRAPIRKDTKTLKSCLKSTTRSREERLDPSVRARQEAIRAQQRLLGKDHPDVLFSLESLARFHHIRGEYRQATKVLQEKDRLSRESYWNHLPASSAIPSNILIVHEEPDD